MGGKKILITESARITRRLRLGGSLQRCFQPLQHSALRCGRHCAAQHVFQGAEQSPSTRETQLVQWYPGHIAKAERSLREQIRVVDVVLEVRDARIPEATLHKQIQEWCGSKPRILVINREDMVSLNDRSVWTKEYTRRRQRAYWTSGQAGKGVPQLAKAVTQLSSEINLRRKARGLQSRSVRACVIGFPNVGKSALINRLINRRACESAPRPGVTRSLKWVRVGGSLDLLDAPGVIPMSFKDQRAARLLAMCNDIGEASYMSSHIAACLVDRLRQLPAADDNLQRLKERFGLDFTTDMTGEEYIHALAGLKFREDEERAGERILTDFRAGSLGLQALELPDDL